MLHHLELDIPVIVVSINITESKELLAFDIKDPKNLMPLSGSILQIRNKIIYYATTPDMQQIVQ